MSPSPPSLPSLEEPLLLSIGADQRQDDPLTSRIEEEDSATAPPPASAGAPPDADADVDGAGGGGGGGGRSVDDVDSGDGSEGGDSAYDPWKNRNVRLSLVQCVLSGISDSVWGTVVLSGFLYALGKAMGQEREDNTLVGAAEAVQGLTQLVFALPIGVVADRVGKAKVVRLGSAVVVVAVVTTLWALRASVNRAEKDEKSEDGGPTDASIADATWSYVAMLVALGLWGVVGGITNGPSQALFADSIRKGRRSEMLTWLYSVYLVASVVGPAVAIALLVDAAGKSEDWSLDQIYPVFVLGICLELPVAVVMCFFSDRHVVKEGDDAGEQQQEGGGSSETGGRGGNSSEEGTADRDSGNVVTSASDESNDVPTTSGNLALGRASVPYVLFLSSLVVSLASGASVKYFPLFFKELGLSSAQVQLVFAGVPLSISAFSFVSQKLSVRLGRIEATVLLSTVGVSLLYFMTYLSRDESNLDSACTWLIVVVYLLRTGIMNGSYPILQSVLMDAVPSNRRARWQSLDSIAAFGWTGSALVGGILSDRHSYRFTFAITASMQLLGSLMLLPIRPFVDPEEGTGTGAGAGASGNVRGRAAGHSETAAETEEGESDPSRPLLDQP